MSVIVSVLRHLFTIWWIVSIINGQQYVMLSIKIPKHYFVILNGQMTITIPQMVTADLENWNPQPGQNSEKYHRTN